jgi:membrane associated rhomboid family serine protease
MFTQRKGSVVAALLVLLTLLLLFKNGTPSWFGGITWAIFPQNTHQWKGIWLGAFIHGSWDHLWGNVVALSIFSALFLIQFPRHWLRFWVLQHVIASFLLWLLGNVGMSPSQTGTAHIGASIWVYAFGGFILTVGILQRTKQSMAIFFLVLLVYGGFFWGLLPIDPKVSWQGHLSGLLTGSFIALWMSKRWLPPAEISTLEDQEEWAEDPYEDL